MLGNVLSVTVGKMQYTHKVSIKLFHCRLIELFREMYSEKSLTDVSVCA